MFNAIASALRGSLEDADLRGYNQDDSDFVTCGVELAIRDVADALKGQPGFDVNAFYRLAGVEDWAE